MEFLKDIRNDFISENNLFYQFHIFSEKKEGVTLWLELDQTS